MLKDKIGSCDEDDMKADDDQRTDREICDNTQMDGV